MSQPTSPYAPPQSDVAPEAPTVPNAAQVLATRSIRLAGALLDALIYLAAMLPGFVLVLLFPERAVLSSQVLLLGMGIVAVANIMLVATQGQSLGKRVLKIRIVKLDGSPCGFVNGVLLRSWLMAILGLVPVIGVFVSLFDPFFIFGEERRCLHDYLAGTKVISIDSGGAAHSAVQDAWYA